MRAVDVDTTGLLICTAIDAWDQYKIRQAYFVAANETIDQVDASVLRELHKELFET